ncbi:MAG: hypothetical protein ACM3ZV_03920 [Bacillota bacterium]
MTTVVARSFASVPARSATDTWAAIVEMLTRGGAGPKRDELLSVAGIAASLISDRSPQGSSIVVTCDGPRTRIRCVYDEDAIDGTGINEAGLGFDPLSGDWHVSLPCPADDLQWVQASLTARSKRITARDLSETHKPAEEAASAAPFEIDPQGFLS